MLHVETYHGSGIENGNPDQSPTGGKSVKNDATTVYASKNPARASENACAKKDSFTCLENETSSCHVSQLSDQWSRQSEDKHN